MQNRRERIWEILSYISFIYRADVTTQKAVYDVQFYNEWKCCKYLRLPETLKPEHTTAGKLQIA